MARYKGIDVYGLPDPAVKEKLGVIDSFLRSSAPIAGKVIKRVRLSSGLTTFTDVVTSITSGPIKGPVTKGIVEFNTSSGGGGPTKYLQIVIQLSETSRLWRDGQTFFTPSVPIGHWEFEFAVAAPYIRVRIVAFNTNATDTISLAQLILALT